MKNVLIFDCIFIVGFMKDVIFYRYYVKNFYWYEIKFGSYFLFVNIRKMFLLVVIRII